MKERILNIDCLNKWIDGWIHQCFNEHISKYFWKFQLFSYWLWKMFAIIRDLVWIIKFIDLFWEKKPVLITLIALNTSKRKCSIFNPLFFHFDFPSILLNAVESRCKYCVGTMRFKTHFYFFFNLRYITDRTYEPNNKPSTIEQKPYLIFVRCLDRII